MPSPFPGMNPYIERDTVWHDFHQRFATAVAELLMPQVRPHYITQVDVDIYVHEMAADERRLLGRPDASISLLGMPQGNKGAATIEAPAEAQIPAPVDIVKLAYVEIRDRERRDLVCAIELLSPSTKSKPEDRVAYLAKRQRLFRSNAHFVEIDLLRGGPRLPMDDLPDCDYYAMVSRAENRPRVGVWPLRLRDPLPVIPIPLRAPDPDARLDLRQVLDRVYDGAGYEDYIYSGKPQPPLHPADEAWASEFRKPGT